MSTLIERITVFCFAASYVVALGLELWRLFQPRPILRLASLIFGAAGLLAQTAFVIVQPLPLVSPFGSLMFLAWILAVFYFYGSVHHGSLSWGLFVLPLVLGLVALAQIFPADPGPREQSLWQLLGLRGESFWGMMHGGLLLLAGVGVCVAFVASVMYFVQLHRLRAKTAPTHGVRMWSLERIENMNRRAILWAFPLLTAGLIVGIALQLSQGSFMQGWTSLKIASSLGLWIVFAILLYMRYGAHVRGRQAALWTFIAFALLLVVLIAPVHPFVQGGR